MNFKPQALDALFRRSLPANAPGAALSVTLQGKPIYQGAWGLASVENPQPLTTRSVFNAGSLAKQFTAFAILRLQQQRKLKLDDEARKHIPELPYYGKPLRLRHLLWHTSGLRCYTTLLWWGGVAQRDNFSRKQALELICRQKELNFAPGSECLYSNSNYLLLSEIVERLSGESLAAFCEKQAFRPYGMNSTHFRDRPSLPIAGLVSGHFEWEGGLLVDRSLGAVPGVGRLMTHVEDLARWERFFTRPLKQDLPLLRGMLAPGWLEGGAKIRFASGLMLQRYRGLAVQRHDGATPGGKAEFCRFPEKGVTISCLSNRAGVDATWMARQVADLLWGRELEPVSALGPGQGAAPAPKAKLPAKSLKAREGLYRAADEGPFAELSLGAQGLELRSARQKIALAAESPMSFQGLGPARICRLDFEEDGGFILTKQGRAVRYALLKPALSTPEAKLERFTGRYASPELVSRMDVFTREGRLWMSDQAGFEWELRHLKGAQFYSQFRSLHFSKRGLVMEAADHWLRRLKWIKL
jgi:CubicO group peptidase (beta-lactamase class C family)